MVKEVGLKPEDLEANAKDEEYKPTEDAPKNINKGGRPTKHYDDCGPKAKKQKLQPTLDQVVAKATEIGKSVPQTLGKLGEMYANQEIDKPKAKMFKAIASEENPLSHKQMSVEQACALKVEEFSIYKTGLEILIWVDS